MLPDLGKYEGSGYIDRIASREPDIRHAMDEYEFPDLRGRWYLVQGHLDVHSWLDAEEKDERRLRSRWKGTGMGLR